MYCRTTKFEIRKTGLQNTLTLNSYSLNGKQTAERFLTYQVSRCFRVVWSQFWAFSKCLSALETTTNNQEVKRGLHRLQNVNNLPKDYIRLCYRSLAETDINPVQQSLTLVNRREHVFSKGNSHQMFCYISFSNDEQFSSKFFEESLFCVPNYIIISLQVTSPRTMKTTSLTRIYSNCLQSFIPK